MYLRDAAAGASDSSLPPGNSVIAPATISKNETELQKEGSGYAVP